jgi:flavin reductase (DIM6/NTAB) family NADH-FMN oxidoreductase RutF
VTTYLSAGDGVDLADSVHSGLARCPVSVYVVTSRAADGAAVGATATSVTSVSIAPPKMLVCLAATSATLEGVLASGRLSLHALAAVQEPMAQAFARGGVKFRGVPWAWSRWQTPRLPDFLVRLEGVVSQAMNVADHVVVIADVVGVEHGVERAALLRIGHSFG